MSLESRSIKDAFLGKLLDTVPRLVGASRLYAARLAECERCAQVVDKYLQELSTWTSADDHGNPIEHQRVVAAALLEAARRIRKRNHDRTRE